MESGAVQDSPGPDGTEATPRLHRALQAAFAVQGGAALTALRAIDRSLFNRAQGLGRGPVLRSGCGGTLDGTVSAEMEVGPSVRGLAEVVERHRGSGEDLCRDWRDRPLDW